MHYQDTLSATKLSHDDLWTFRRNTNNKQRSFNQSVSIDLSNDTLLRRHHKLVDSCDWQFLSEIINVRDDVFSFDFSDGFTLSCQDC